MFVKSFYLCILHNDKICTTYVEIRIKSCHIWLNFKTYLQNRFHSCDNLCQKLLKKRICAKEVYTFIMDSEAIFYWKSLQLIRLSWSDFEASCMFTMFAGNCVLYVYSISVFINKQKWKWIKTYVFKICINTLNYSNFSKCSQETWSPTLMATVCVTRCAIVLFFVWRFTCFENNEDKIINK